MRLLTLADHLRAWGLDVVEVDGWQSRGVDFPARPQVVVAHHTGTAASAPGDYPTLRIVRDGRSDLPGPLCQVGLGRSGKVYVVAAGKANHAGVGAWRGIDVGNSRSVGVEAESPGDGTWTAAQRAVYPKLAAALIDLLGTDARYVCAHRESALPAGRKVDPAGIDMDVFRREVAAHLNAHHTVTAQAATPVTPLEEDDMHLLVDDPGSTAWWVVRADLSLKVLVEDNIALDALKKSGRYVQVALGKRQLAAVPTAKA